MKVGRRRMQVTAWNQVSSADCHIDVTVQDELKGLIMMMMTTTMMVVVVVIMIVMKVIVWILIMHLMMAMVSIIACH